MSRAEVDGENVKTRVRSVVALDAALGRTRAGLCIVADGAGCAPKIC